MICFLLFLLSFSHFYKLRSSQMNGLHFSSCFCFFLLLVRFQFEMWNIFAVRLITMLLCYMRYSLKSKCTFFQHKNNLFLYEFLCWWHTHLEYIISDDVQRYSNFLHIFSFFLLLVLYIWLFNPFDFLNFNFVFFGNYVNIISII